MDNCNTNWAQVVKPTNVIQEPDGSRKEIFADGTVRQRFHDALELISFASGMQRAIFPNGIVVDNYPDGSAAAFTPNGATITIAVDGRSYYYDRGDHDGVLLSLDFRQLLPLNMAPTVT